ncbi:hypothetical protein BN7_1909 [Wickerhamomyces ciferrii]|uniref:Ty3 transposon capsid-like protein domain-containing protein n=1 Tax=Wickerhamomyces ciferrii (strain ATCC 14091 / BCRC 22168 / CBS 111 / JCM 3599 / NBRC 0793 / NRRL Y-1031 F-60-10) TaxID=1206466 RepID=K0KLY5_WICCF|nr:uncharacterized protein BN7_1909 [Wickerhamomyces ciferrii]CCH42364.1 hypothetical protein BN7_1909 [Wickerhamomyces ciferrii]
MDYNSLLLQHLNQDKFLIPSNLKFGIMECAKFNPSYISKWLNQLEELSFDRDITTLLDYKKLLIAATSGPARDFTKQYFTTFTVPFSFLNFKQEFLTHFGGIDYIENFYSLWYNLQQTSDIDQFNTFFYNLYVQAPVPLQETEVKARYLHALKPDLKYKVQALCPENTLSAMKLAQLQQELINNDLLHNHIDENNSFSSQTSHDSNSIHGSNSIPNNESNQSFVGDYHEQQSNPELLHIGYISKLKK